MRGRLLKDGSGESEYGWDGRINRKVPDYAITSLPVGSRHGTFFYV